MNIIDFDPQDLMEGLMFGLGCGFDIGNVWLFMEMYWSLRIHEVR